MGGKQGILGGPGVQRQDGGEQLRLPFLQPFPQTRVGLRTEDGIRLL